TLSVRTRAAAGQLPQLFGQTYGVIMQYLGELGEQPVGMSFAAYYNMDMQDLDIEIGFPVSRPLPDRGNIHSGALPAGPIAVTMHIGPYDTVGPAYEALTHYAQANGYAPSGVAYEFYFSDPQTPPEQIQTQVMFPLQPVLQLACSAVETHSSVFVPRPCLKVGRYVDPGRTTPRSKMR
ncbi:MAG TPA: GyrI-like domain-containing protein, partial [Anaerolineae bacterium]|nr:GyrI-like domain-containing protein [Anaerolineae bacterium]